jgi:drug/metabolite transporter (DMT)-like permease
MKLILSLLGVVLLIVAGVYFLIPGEQLPSFFPGHEVGVMRVHTKHGVVAAVAGLVLLAAGWWMGRR